MIIYCCGCENKINGRLIFGKEIYPHRQDLWDLPFWKCDTCGNHVGCHHKTNNPTKPLGCIPTKEIKRARQYIHDILDPLWRRSKNKKKERAKVYKKISDKFGWKYHTAEIRSIEDARNIYKYVKGLQ